MSKLKAQSLKTQTIPAQELYAHVLGGFDELHEGEQLELLLNHDPSTLCQELVAQRPLARVLSTERIGANEWRAMIAHQ